MGGLRSSFYKTKQSKQTNKQTDGPRNKQTNKHNKQRNNKIKAAGQTNRISKTCKPVDIHDNDISHDICHMMSDMGIEMCNTYNAHLIYDAQFRPRDYWGVSVYTHTCMYLWYTQFDLRNVTHDVWTERRTQNAELKTQNDQRRSSQVKTLAHRGLDLRRP